jgi:ferredoxin-fold anticodon binding domain-containing protein
MAIIFVSRKHVSGNLTLGFYTVDLQCMGVGGTWYKYNIPEIKIMAMMADIAKEKLRLVEISYKLAHNIIYAAIENAEGYGFHPVADFTRVSQYILEPDTEDIPLINIPCGVKEETPDRQATQQMHVLERMRKIAKSRHGGIEEEISREKEKKINEYNKIRKRCFAMTEEERKTQFIEFVGELEHLTGEEKNKMLVPMIILADVIIRSNADNDKVNELIKTFKKNFDCKIINTFDLPNSYFTGMQHRSIDKLIKEYRKITDQLGSGDFKQAIEKIREDYNDLPFVSYLELRCDINLKKDEFLEKLNSFSQKFPDYLMFKILQYEYADHEKLETMLSEISKPVTVFELFEFLYAYLKSCIENSDCPLEKMVVFESLIDDYKKAGITPADGFFSTMLSIKIDIVKKYYGIEKKEKPQTD